jgi:hypothetical protein
VAVTYTGSPSATLPGQVTGAPVRLPHVMLCTQGERHCGTRWTANTPRQLAEHAAARRAHEAACNGGLIIPGR